MDGEFVIFLEDANDGDLKGITEMYNSFPNKLKLLTMKNNLGNTAL